jgi:hypothetical protein
MNFPELLLLARFYTELFWKGTTSDRLIDLSHIRSKVASPSRATLTEGQFRRESHAHFYYGVCPLCFGCPSVSAR